MPRTAVGSLDGGDWKKVAKVLGVVMAVGTVATLWEKEKWDARDAGRFVLSCVTIAAAIFG